MDALPRPDPDEGSVKDAILEKALKGRMPTDLMLRCMKRLGLPVSNGPGNVKTISGQFKKSELCAEHRLNPRDLRKIDSRVPNLVPTILARREAILVNILHIRALIKADTVILFDSYGSADSRLHSVFLYHLEHNLKAKSPTMPYEFRALESVLLSVVSALEAEMVFLRNHVGSVLAELEDDIDREKFRRLLHCSRKLSGFHNRAKLVQEALDEVLEQDEDMTSMYLTDKIVRRDHNMQDHEELEVLLESFSKQVEEIVTESDSAMSNVTSTQEIVDLILDSNRNALLTLDLKVSIMTMGIGSSTLIAGLFGMNLQSHLETDPYAFYAMSAFCLFLAVAASAHGLRTLSRIRRVGLSAGNGESRRRSSTPWLPLPLRRRGPEGWR
ncbi:cora-domain-containing protein [Auricularia subglabra TFB-10046 SS5]|nr:cora-domain-containing protein [Auricularia subglabra TFB-10046 SS5]